MVPNLSSSMLRKHEDDFIAIGRILIHTIVLTKSLPNQISQVTYLQLSDRGNVEDEVLLQDFYNFVTQSEKVLITRAKRDFDTLTERERDELSDFFQTYGLGEIPKRDEIVDQLLALAKKIMIKQTRDYISKMKEGIPLCYEYFFNSLTTTKLKAILRNQWPTATKVLKIIQTRQEDLTNDQFKSLYFFKTYVKNLERTKLVKLLYFITGSPHMPTGSKKNITVSFNALSGFSTNCASLFEYFGTSVHY